MRFRKRVKVFPGFYLNFSNSGVSSTIAVRGASISFGKRGTYLNTSISGTGLSQRQKIGGFSSGNPGNLDFYSPTPAVIPPGQAEAIIPRAGEIKSADKGALTSSSMHEMKDTIQEAFQDRIEITEEIRKSEKQLKTAKTIRLIANMFIVGFLIKWFKENVFEKEDYLLDLQAQYRNAKVDVDITLSETLKPVYQRLMDAYTVLSKSEMIWDITSNVAHDSLTTRSAASEAITRTKVTFTFECLDVINSQFSAFHLQNANGDDLYIYPAFIVVTKNKKDFALIDVCDLQIDFVTQKFLEEERMPSDTVRIGETWAKVNKNGQPDRRFKGNYQIPIVKYGQINLRTNSGLNEAYSLSNHSSTEGFVQVFREYQQTLRPISKILL